MIGTRAALSALLLVGAHGAAQAQSPVTGTGWQACAAVPGHDARLACFDGWAQRQQLQPAPGGPQESPAPSAEGPAAGATGPGAGPRDAGVGATMDAERAAAAEQARAAAVHVGCRDGRYTPLSRFWELERATDCGTFELRGYRPTALAISASDSVNELPASPAPGRTTVVADDYRTTEARVQLSARVKVARDLLTRRDDARSDSLWLGYSQQSFWQVFTPGLSRPFRTTDYEPEAMYVYPADVELPFGWRLRHAGLGLSHQSNGSRLPQSRSWNRAYLMAGLEHGHRFSLQGRLWKRTGEGGTDDNPDIVSLIGRAELTGTWHADRANTLSATVRHSLRADGNGSLRLEYFRAIGRGSLAGNVNELRLHLQLFSGYGDSLLDYNRRRNVFSLGLALVDW